MGKRSEDQGNLVNSQSTFLNSLQILSRMFVPQDRPSRSSSCRKKNPETGDTLYGKIESPDKMLFQVDILQGFHELN